MSKKTTIKIVKHKLGGYVVVHDNGKYAVDGGWHYGYHPGTDPCAIRTSLRDIRDEHDGQYIHGIPSSWPHGIESIDVTMIQRS